MLINCDYQLTHEQKKYDNRKDVVLSVHPRYISEIIAGRKTVELRRKPPNRISAGSRLYFYSTSPVQALVAVGEVEKIDTQSIGQLWQRFADKACISKSDFEKYFFGLQFGSAISLKGIRTIEPALSREFLKKSIGFTPPQSYMYMKEEFYTLFDSGPNKISY